MRQIDQTLCWAIKVNTEILYLDGVGAVAFVQIFKWYLVFRCLKHDSQRKMAVTEHTTHTYDNAAIVYLAGT